MLAAERAGDICYTSLDGCIKAQAVLGLCTWDRLVVSVCMQLDAQQILQRSVQLSPCHVGTVPSAVVLLCMRTTQMWWGKLICVGCLSFAATEQQLLRHILWGDSSRQGENKVNPQWGSRGRGDHISLKASWKNLSKMRCIFCRSAYCH